MWRSEHIILCRGVYKLSELSRDLLGGVVVELSVSRDLLGGVVVDLCVCHVRLELSHLLGLLL